MSLSFRDTYDSFYRWYCISVLPNSNSEEWEHMGTGFNEVHEAITGHCWNWDMGYMGVHCMYTFKGKTVWKESKLKDDIFKVIEYLHNLKHTKPYFILHSDTYICVCLGKKKFLGMININFRRGNGMWDLCKKFQLVLLYLISLKNQN